MVDAWEVSPIERTPDRPDRTRIPVWRGAESATILAPADWLPATFRSGYGAFDLTAPPVEQEVTPIEHAPSIFTDEMDRRAF